MHFIRNFNLLYFIIIFFNINFCLSMEMELPKEFFLKDQQTSPLKKKYKKDFQDKENIPPKIQEKIHALQKAYIHNDSTSLSPASKQHLAALKRSLQGGIKNPNVITNIQSKTVFYSPFTREYFSRRQITVYKNNGFVVSLPANAYSEYVELPPETKEEKKARKERQLAYFQSLNNIDYSTFEDLQEREAAYWVPYWNFIKIEKEKVSKAQRGKLRPEELEDIAKSTSLSHYQNFKVAGTTFYYHLDFLDFSINDSLGRTNVQRLKHSLNPLGLDGLAMEVHHLTMFDDSILVLLSRSLHEGGPLKKAANDNQATFHPQPSYYGRTKSSDIDRANFAKIVKEICEKLVEISNEAASFGTSEAIPVDDDELDNFFAAEEKADDTKAQSLEAEEITLQFLSTSKDQSAQSPSSKLEKKSSIKRKLSFL